jgi:hypothetical protein
MRLKQWQAGHKVQYMPVPLPKTTVHTSKGERHPPANSGSNGRLELTQPKMAATSPPPNPLVASEAMYNAYVILSLPVDNINLSSVNWPVIETVISN